MDQRSAFRLAPLRVFAGDYPTNSDEPIHIDRPKIKLTPRNGNCGLRTYALKEVYEGRTKANLKRHLGRRRRCRVSFGSCDAIATTSIVEAIEQKKKVECNPPLYGDLFKRRETPPPPYDHEKIQEKTIKNIDEIPRIPVIPLKSALKRRQ
ncbi:unnamed protein product, partial [Mesorhabditis belari]|uniref:Uncharacterized protein n=1 Tax=Mesorhabditis belari TaxID=2138241 RepID=A0AAF3FBL8_9BILA